MVISNDSDIAEAMRLVKEQNKKKVGLLSPVDSPSNVLKQHSNFIKDKGWSPSRFPTPYNHPWNHHNKAFRMVNPKHLNSLHPEKFTK
jgi:hypothetical protein